MKTSSMYAEVACQTTPSFESVASTIARMIDGATLTPKPMGDRQYLFLSRITVSGKATKIYAHALINTPFFLHSLNFCTQKLACTV